MNHPSESRESIESLARELRRMRLIFGLTIIAISLVLTISLPSVIRSAVFRVSNDPDSRGLFTMVIELIRGEPVVFGEVPLIVPSENPESSESVGPEYEGTLP